MTNRKHELAEGLELPEDEAVVFTPEVTADDEFVVTDSKAAEIDIKTALDTIDDADGHIKKYNPARPATADEKLILKMKELSRETSGIANAQVNANKVRSDGSTASYYELPVGAKELQHLISFKNLNAQMGEIFRAVYRYGEVAHSEKIRDAKKIKYYIEAEIARLEKYGDS